jgi:hypothetical protein
MGAVIISVGVLVGAIAQAILWWLAWIIIVQVGFNHNPPKPSARTGLLIVLVSPLLLGTMANLVIGIGAARVRRRAAAGTRES